jgi:hypothetical protein
VTVETIYDLPISEQRQKIEHMLPGSEVNTANKNELAIKVVLDTKKRNKKKNQKSKKYLVTPDPRKEELDSESSKNEASHIVSTSSSSGKPQGKKEQYKKELINDKNGDFDFEKNPHEYKKARK